MSAHIRGRDNVGDIFYTLSLNFLLYVTLIIVFYMLVRFYFEEEVVHKNDAYHLVSTQDDDSDEKDIDTKVDTADETELVELDKVDKLEPPPSQKSNSFLNVNEWGEPDGTKQEVIQKALFCALGLNISFGIWGLVQERILTQTYDGDFFEYSYGLVFFNRLGGLIFSAYLMRHFKVDWVSSPLWEYSFPSVANMLSSWCQYEALKYVSFPTQMLAKAFKIVPVMLMGKFLHNKSYESYEYISAGMIGLGLYLFLDSSEHINFRENVFGDTLSMRGSACGVVLLILFLFFDSFTGQWQTRMFQLNKQLSPLQMMLIMNAFSAVFSFITLVHQEEFMAQLEFVQNHPEMIVHLLIFCICSTVGQLFIFYTGAHIFAIIMSIRILFSTLLSCVVYSHPLTELSFVGMAIVFGGIAYRIRRKTKGRPLIRYRETETAKEVFHEWHEHVDV